jgi:hypothetical protein
MTVKLTWVHEPKYLTAPPPGTMMTTGPEIYAPFIRELERVTGTEITVVTGLLPEVAPSDGVILLHPRRDLKSSFERYAAKIREGLAPRCIAVFTASPLSAITQAVDELCLGGLVDSIRVDEWQCAPSRHGPDVSLYGRRDLAAGTGARCLVESSGRYCELSPIVPAGLPSLVAAYAHALSHALSL